MSERSGSGSPALSFVARSMKRRRLVGPVLRAAAPLLPTRDAPRDPIFIVGSPRSGTSLLFEILDRSPRLASLAGESHLLWELFHPSRSRSWTSHQVLPSDITPRERRALYWMIDRVARDRRYLDKSPRNSLRVAYLDELFPTARFVFLTRDGRAAVSSLLTAWRSNDRRFPGTPLRTPLAVEGYRGRNWKFVVPPGWEAYARGMRLAEVCAFQWAAATEAILDGKARVPAERWLELRYEDLVADPVAHVERLLDAVGLPPDAAVLAHAAELDAVVTRAVTPPRPGKWREENGAEVRSVLPMIAPTMRRLGYDPDEAATA